eukprot:gi/632964652/ref/XP_007898500.1/ PREDICTED: uncharacterized protein LOC103183062 [Callorhinchus milii]
MCFSRCLTDEACLKQKGENVVYIFCTAVPNSSFYSSDVSVLSFFGTDFFGIGTIDRTIFNSSKLVSVTNLTIASSKVKTIERGAFRSFFNLASLDLDNNQLNAINASWFSNPASLVSLSLSRNNIHLISEDTLSLFSSLKMLDLSWNKIAGIAGRSFKSNPHLSTLNFSANQLSFLSAKVFEGVPTREMDLTKNPWNCSCELMEFASFLRDLVNKSVLEKQSAVACLDPSRLKGIPIWNVSDFHCPVTGSTTVPYEHPTVSPLSHQTQLPIVLVLLALVLFFSFLILLLIKRKHDKKPVIPEKNRTEKKETYPQEGIVNENPDENHWTKANISVSVLETDEEKMNDAHKRVKEQANFATGDRSEVPFQQETIVDESAEFAICDQALPSSPAKTPPTRSQLLLEHEQGRKRERISNITGDVEMGIYKGRVCEKQTIVLDIKSLIIVQNQGVANITRQERNEDGKPIGTILPFSKITNSDVSTISNGMHHDEHTNNTASIRGNDSSLRSPLGTRSFKPDGDEALYDARASLMNALDGSVVERQCKYSQNARNDMNGTALENEASGENVGLVKGRRETGSQRIAKGLQSGKNSFENDDISEIRPSPVSLKGTRKEMSKERHTTAAATRPQVTPACEGIVDTSSTTEDQLLHSSEYGYVNLLHEVVKNQGRWTRERWKQTHNILRKV